jgi:multiple sugar transport system permease protein
MILLIVFIGVSPFGNALLGSFYHDVYGDRSFAGLENYRLLFNDRGFGYSLNITVLWAVLNAVLSLAAGFVFAVRLVKRNRFGKFFYAALLIPWGIPVYIAVPLWRALIHGNGGESLLTILFGIQINLLTDGVLSFLATLVVSIWMTVPLTTFVFVGALRKLSRSVVESATMDGASEAEIAFHIYLPQIRGALLVMGVLNFIKSLKEFTVVFLMTAGGPPLISGITEHHIIGSTTTLGIFLYEIFTDTDDLGVSSAYSIVMAFVIILIMGLWFIVRSSDPGHKKIKVFTALTQPIFSGPLGLLWAVGYLGSLKKPRLFFATACIHLTYCTIMILREGFLPKFHPGLIIVVFGLLLVYRRKINPAGKPPIGLRPLWFLSSYGGVA